VSWERPDASPPNPLAWSLPFLRIARMRFRLHFVFVAYAVLLTLMAWLGPVGSTPLHGPASTAMGLAALLLVVLVREVARAAVVRAAGGSADEVMLWPLGTLQGIDPAPGWLAALLAAVVGPAASLVLGAACGAAIGIGSGDWSAAVPDPRSAAWLSNPQPRWLEALWILHWTGIQVALLSLVPALPLDGGRVIEAIAIRRHGAFDAPRVAATWSLAGSAVAGVVAIVKGMPTLLSVAITCAGFAVLMLWRLRAGDAVAASGGWTPGGDPADAAERAERDRERSERERERADRERERLRRAEEERAVDEVLAKIAREGADRLTDEERATLAKATERRRSGGR
jgi:stage IV sporulation protein FB